MASAGAVAVESPARRELGSLAGPECSAEPLRKADSLQARSSISLHGASSGDAGPPRHKRARRDVVRRVWDWLEVSGSREHSVGLGSASDAVQFGQMHLSEGSPATTVITTTLDVSRGDAVEPCVSSLPDIQATAGDTMCVSSKPTEGTAQAPEEALQQSGISTPGRGKGQGAHVEDRDTHSAEAMPGQQAPASCAALDTPAGAAACAPLIDAAPQSQGCGQGPCSAGHGRPGASPAGPGGQLQRQISRKRKHSCEPAEIALADDGSPRSATAEALQRVAA